MAGKSKSNSETVYENEAAQANSNEASTNSTNTGEQSGTAGAGAENGSAQFQGSDSEAFELEVEDARAGGGAGQEQNSAGDAQLETLQQQLLRVHADFDNFRRRTRQEKEDLQLFATKKLLADLLPVVDNFERALATLPQEEQSNLKTGLEMVYRQLTGVFEKYGVVPMESLNQKFDPNLHEAVMQEPAQDGQEPGIVVQELQKGYQLHGKVLRPAMVKVTT
ncbi:nucleotide exchange factor GrpE [Alicyclobacillus tolerans]|uniref:nucleotide exchange factor GrpE n=1 Tax=Alicyclobacillus tolerans TaxID=90970 RepID=UPI001F3A0A9D|nr:nucleotide exchange factor GrpE [Alicyclobacillus tolerans]MCF8563325.1 nucleotide exchange factor GrpE [Alicyclobacillus tolerans]